jgi:hypothetical protein
LNFPCILFSYNTFSAKIEQKKYTFIHFVHVIQSAGIGRWMLSRGSMGNGTAIKNSENRVFEEAAVIIVF